MPEKTIATSPRISDLTRRLQKEPGSRLVFDLAREHHAIGNLEEAEKLCRDGLQKHPGYHSARVLLGRVLIDMQRFPAARPELERVVKQAPDNLLARRLLADALAGDHDPLGALETLKGLLLLKPGDDETEKRISQLEAEIGGESRPAGMDTLPGESPVGAMGAEAIREPAPRDEPATAIMAPEVFEAVAPVEATPPSVAAAMPSTSSRDSGEPVSRGREGTDSSAATVMMQAPQFASAAESTASGEPAPSHPEKPAADSSEDEPTLGALPTPTLAEIYVAQGMPDRALEIYRQVLAGDPQNQEALARVRDLSEKVAPQGSAAHRKIKALEGWLERLRRLNDVQDDARRGRTKTAGM